MHMAIPKVGGGDAFLLLHIVTTSCDAQDPSKTESGGHGTQHNSSRKMKFVRNAVCPFKVCDSLGFSILTGLF